MKNLSIKQTLLYGITTPYKHLGFFIGTFALFFPFFVLGILAFLGINWPTIALVLSKLSGSCEFMTQGTMLNSVEFNKCIADIFSTNFTLHITLFLVGLLVFTFIAIYTALGWHNALLHIYDYKKGSFRALFVHPRLIITGFVAWFLFIIMVTLGMVALIVPGIMAIITFYMFVYAIVDKNAGIIESLRMSARITHGARWRIFLLIIIAILCTGLPLTLIKIGISYLYGVSFVIAQIAYQLIYVYLQLAVWAASVYVYRTLNTQTYAPVK